MPFVFGFAPVLFLFLGSQIYFGWRAAAWILKRVRARAGRIAAIGGGLAIYVVYFFLNVRGEIGRPEPTRMTWWDALVVAPFRWWIFSATIAFLVVVLIWIARGIAGIIRGLIRSVSAPPQP